MGMGGMVDDGQTMVQSRREGGSTQELPGVLGLSTQIQ